MKSFTSVFLNRFLEIDILEKKCGWQFMLGPGHAG
jgi:hypothetical protein